MKLYSFSKRASINARKEFIRISEYLSRKSVRVDPKIDVLLTLYSWTESTGGRAGNNWLEVGWLRK